MFESLDEASARNVRRWEAPRIGRVAPPSSEAVPASPIRTPRADPPGERFGEHVDEGRSAIIAKLSPDVPASSDRAAANDPPDEAALRERFEAGRLQGLADAERESRERGIDEAARLLDSLVRERDSRDALLEGELLELARAMAKLIVRRELEHDVGTMREVVHEALQRLPCLADAPLVRLHPLDAEAVGARMHGRDEVTIVADETLARGDCRIESGATLIDAGIDARVARIGARHGLFEPLERLSSDTDTDTDVRSGQDGSNEPARK